MRKSCIVAPAALALLLVFSFSSCTTWEIAASYDRSKDGEKGPSGETAQYNPGFNAIVEVLDDLSDGGLIWYYDDKVKFEEVPDPWNPERYYAAKKAVNGFGLVTSAGYVEKGRQVFGASEHLSYLEVSEAVAYMHQMSGGVLYGGLGPYIAYGIGGKVNYSGGSEPVFGSDGYKRFDAGLHFLGEYRFKMGVSVGIGYDLGLYDKSTDPSDYTSRNRTMMVEVGYSLDKILKAVRKK